MSFEDLPDDWPTIPLTDPEHVADVLDLVVSRQARHTGALVVVVCDEQRRPVRVLQFEGLPPSPPATALTLLQELAGILADIGRGATFAIARRRRLCATANDHAWRQTIETALAGRVDVLGVHVVTHDGSVPLVAPDEAA